MLSLLIAWILCTFLHLTAMTLAGLARGIPLCEVKFGFGWSIKLGKVRLTPFPLGGSVRFYRTDDPECEADLIDRGRAFDTEPAWVQVLVTLSGGAALLLLAWALVPGLPGQAMELFLVAPVEWLLGMLSPQRSAQALLADGVRLAGEQGFAVTLGVVAAKVAALNLLLPILGSNGWQAVGIVAKRMGLLRETPQWVLMLQLVFTLGLLGAWGWALVLFVSGQA